MTPRTAESARPDRGAIPSLPALARQVAGAQVAAVTNTGGIEAATALLTRW